MRNKCDFCKHVLHGERCRIASSSGRTGVLNMINGDKEAVDTFFHFRAGADH